MANRMFICIEEFPIYSKELGKSGTVKVGMKYELVKEPTPEDKRYVLLENIEHLNFYTKYVNVRKNILKRYFKEVV